MTEAMPFLQKSNITFLCPPLFKEGLFLQFRHAILLMTSSFRSPRPQGPCCGHSKWS